MSQVYPDMCSRNYPEDIPFALQESPAASRWEKTAQRVNYIINTRYPNEWIAIAMLFIPLITGIALLLVILIVLDNTILGVVCFCGSFLVQLTYFLTMACRANAAVKSIRDLIQEENCSFYNKYGVHITFVRGSKNTGISCQQGYFFSGGLPIGVEPQYTSKIIT